MKEIMTFLAEQGIAFKRFDHAAVFTCEEAERLPPMPGTATKNLFLRDRKGKRHILVVVPYDKNVDLKGLCGVIHIDKLSFASPERLKTYLGVEPGSATILGLIADEGHAVEVVIDEAIWHADALQCHPLINTATLVIGHDGIEMFLQATGHAYQIIDVPQRV